MGYTLGSNKINWFLKKNVSKFLYPQVHYESQKEKYNMEVFLNLIMGSFFFYAPKFKKISQDSSLHGKETQSGKHCIIAKSEEVKYFLISN